MRNRAFIERFMFPKRGEQRKYFRWCDARDRPNNTFYVKRSVVEEHYTPSLYNNS